MNWTRTDATRRRIVVVGLIAGPLLLVLSVAINFSAPTESMRADFDAMTAHSGLIVAEALLETIGFMMVLAALAGATQTLRTRGGALGTWGAVLAILGIAGFSLSNANGFTMAALAQLADHDAAFETAKALMSSDTTAVTGTVSMGLELAGQAGIVLIVIGLIRARLVRVWLLVLVAAGMVLNFVGGIMLTTLIADVLLLAVCTLIAVSLARTTHEEWLGVSTVVARPRTRQAA